LKNYLLSRICPFKIRLAAIEVLSSPTSARNKSSMHSWARESFLDN
jgi:hypothetical protein